MYYIHNNKLKIKSLVLDPNILYFTQNYKKQNFQLGFIYQYFFGILLYLVN